MSAALYLKQNICQLKTDEMLEILQKFYASHSQKFSVQNTQKAYKCFECSIIVGTEKYCSGFGRNEEEATLNAGRIAIESIIDSGDTFTIKKIFEGETEKDSLESLLEKFLASSYYDELKKEGVKYEDLVDLSLEGLSFFFPIGLSIKIYNHFHPLNSEVVKLREENEVRVN